MTSVTDVVSHAISTAVDVIGDVIQDLEHATQAVVQAVVEVAIAVSEALSSGTWGEFFAKLQEVFQALDKLRLVRASVNFENLPNNLNRREKELVEELRHRLDLAMAEAAALKKLVLDEARRRQGAQASEAVSRFEPVRPPLTRI